MSGTKTNSGEALNAKWKVDARHALYHKDGRFYMPLERFPGAYFDPRGYVVFKTESDFLESRYLRIGKRVNVTGGIWSEAKAAIAVGTVTALTAIQG